MTIFLIIVAILFIIGVFIPLRRLWIIQNNPLLDFTCPPRIRAALGAAVRRRLLYLVITIGLLIYFW